MTQPERSHSDSSSRRKRAHRAWVPQILVRFFSEWRAQAFVALLAALALFLLVERMQIRVTFLGWVRQGYQSLTALVGGSLLGLVSFVRNTTLSDLTAYLFLLIVVVIVVWRTRWRIDEDTPLHGA